jgi:hypothetical protein
MHQVNTHQSRIRRQYLANIGRSRVLFNPQQILISPRNSAAFHASAKYLPAMKTSAFITIIIAVLAHAPSPAHAMFPPAKDKGPVARAVKTDVKYIKCQVCELAADAAYEEYVAVAADKGKKLTELDVLERVEKLCDVSDKAADWIINKDLQEKGTKLKVVDMGKEVYGKCGVECKTIVKACEDVLGPRDTDVAEYLLTTATSAKDVHEWLCREETSSCSSAPPPLPKDRPKGEKFVKREKKDVDMERLMASMQGMPGMGGAQMFNREDMMAGMGGMGGDDDDDDENPYGSFDPSMMSDSNEGIGAKINDVAAKAKDSVKNAWGGVKSLFSKKNADEEL